MHRMDKLNANDLFEQNCFQYCMTCYVGKSVSISKLYTCFLDLHIFVVKGLDIGQIISNKNAYVNFKSIVLIKYFNENSINEISH